MKVSELIEILEGMDQEADVHFTYNYGDHWRTQVAPKVREVFEPEVCWSEYHRMPKIVEDDSSFYEDEDAPESEQPRSVVCLG